MRLHRVCPGREQCDRSVPRCCRCPWTRPLLLASLQVQQCRCLSPDSLVTQNVCCSGRFLKPPLRRNLCETSLRNSPLIGEPAGWRFSEITARQVTRQVIPQDYVNRNNEHKRSIINSFLPKSLQKVSPPLPIGSTPQEQRVSGGYEQPRHSGVQLLCKTAGKMNSEFIRTFPDDRVWEGRPTPQPHHR